MFWPCKCSKKIIVRRLSEPFLNIVETVPQGCCTGDLQISGAAALFCIESVEKAYTCVTIRILEEREQV